jgi:hypothetical protein
MLSDGETMMSFNARAYIIDKTLVEMNALMARRASEVVVMLAGLNIFVGSLILPKGELLNQFQLEQGLERSVHSG